MVCRDRRADTRGALLLRITRNYVLRRGFRDGVPGLIVSLMNSYYVFLKFAKLWELRHRKPQD